MQWQLLRRQDLFVFGNHLDTVA